MKISLVERKFLIEELSTLYQQIFSEKPIFNSTSTRTEYIRLEKEITNKINDFLDDCFQKTCKKQDTCKKHRTDENAKPFDKHYCDLEKESTALAKQLTVSSKQLSLLLYISKTKDSVGVSEGFIRAVYIYINKDRVEELAKLDDVEKHTNDKNKNEIENDSFILQPGGYLTEGSLVNNICNLLEENLKSGKAVVRVAVDWVIYGIMSSPQNFDLYFNYLLELSKTNRLKLLVPKRNLQLIILKKQIDKVSYSVNGEEMVLVKGNINKFINRPEVQNLIDSDQLYNIDDKKYIPTNSFYTLLLDVEKHYQDILELHSEISFLNQPIFQFIWWSDFNLPTSRIIVGLPDFSGAQVEDKGFIFEGGYVDEYFNTIWETYKKISEPLAS